MYTDSYTHTHLYCNVYMSCQTLVVVQEHHGCGNHCANAAGGAPRHMDRHRVTITFSKAYLLALLSTPSLSEKAEATLLSIRASWAHDLSWAEGVMRGNGKSPCLVGSAAPGDIGGAAGASSDAAVDMGKLILLSSACVAPATLLMSEPCCGDELKVLLRASTGASCIWRAALDGAGV